MGQISIKQFLMGASALTLALLMAGCSVGADSKKLGGAVSLKGEIKLPGAANVSATDEEIDYKWNYPKYPEQYQVNPLERKDQNGNEADYLSGRSLAENGSYAGPWIEGEDAKLLPVANPNVPLGNLLFDQLKTRITPAMMPRLEDTPFQAFLKLREGLKGTPSPVVVTMNAFVEKVGGDGKTERVPVPVDEPITLDNEALWSLAFALYVKLEPNWKETVPVKLDPTSIKDKSKQKNGQNIFGNCNMCHGADGWGKGHSGMTLQPPPANFHEPHRLYNRSETNLRMALKNGVYGSAMPQWKDRLSDDEINHVVAYIRTFSYSTDPPIATVKPAGGTP
jgi:mono/diheme cytochrome c family protein